MLRSRLLLAVALVSTLASPARAARTHHLFLDESQLVPEGEVELEQWVWSYGRIPAIVDRPASIWVWWGPVVGVTPHLELELPLQLVSVPDETYLHSISLVARYRLFPREDDRGWQPLVRVAYAHPLTRAGGPPTVDVTAVVTWGGPDMVRVTGNLGVHFALPALQSSLQGAPWSTGNAGLGVTVPLTPRLRVGAETFGQVPLRGDTRPRSAQLYVGPSLSWSRGPLWVTAGSLFGIGDESSRFWPRVLWGVTL